MKTTFDKIGLALLICLFPCFLSAQVLTLPFFDDFNSSYNYPDSVKWADRNAYVNSGFPRNPITHNAATLDVLDANGRVYDYAISNPFIAEHLTSNIIRLDSIFEPEPKALEPADSLYFSFFYQPQGNGNPPESQDSLVLEFGLINMIDSIVTDTAWYHVWSTPGDSLSRFVQENGGNYFKQVMIPITDLKYFSPGFCFRFYNYASILNSSQPSGRGNEDNWNIGPVYLDYNRSIYDPSYPKISFGGKAPSFLNRYKSMPYKHYRTNPSNNIAVEIEYHASNLDNQQHNLKYYYTVEQVAGSHSYSYDGSDAWNLDPMVNYYPGTSIVNKLFPIDVDRDTTSYIIRHYLVDYTCNPPMIDSLVCHQGFYNYFAYDDGSPEKGYGVDLQEGAFAVKFELAEMDTICGVQLLFNHTLRDANDQYFDIVVWKDNNNKPGEELYRLTNCKLRWEEQLYKFSYYRFNKLVRYNGIFYVGIVQHSNGNINIGFDASTDNSQYNYYNINGSWQQSSLPGSIMLRPVVGGDYYIGVDEQLVDHEVRVYPNPASSVIHIEGIDNGSSVAIYDITGRRVMHETYHETLTVGHLSNGLYLVNITTVEGIVISKKIMINQ